jgi:hypothetical protein
MLPPETGATVVFLSDGKNTFLREDRTVAMAAVAAM